MNLRSVIVTAMVGCSVPVLVLAAPNSALPPNVKLAPNVALTPFDAQPGQICAFYGSLKAVDHSAHTVTLAMPMQFTFKVTAGTPITVRKAGAVPWGEVRAGGGAEIVGRRGQGKTNWTAVKITLEPGASFPEEMSVTTTGGKTLSGAAAGEFIVHEPPAEVVNRNMNFGHHMGTYRLAVQPDGTVAGVTTVKSMGVKELDERASSRLRQFKFRPGSVKEARVSVIYDSFRR